MVFKKKIFCRKLFFVQLILILFIFTVCISFYNTDFNYTEIYSSFEYQQYNIENPHNYEYILKPKRNVCESDNITLIALVTTAAHNFERRSVIRKTWANKKFLNLKTVFIVGRSLNDSVNDKLITESIIHDDIVQESFMDTYKNLTLKTIATLKWVSIYCKNRTKFILKVDDDMIVNTYALLPFLEKYQEPIYDSFICNPRYRSKVIRNTSHKYYVSKAYYPQEYYNPYCSGGAYLISPDLPYKLYKESLLTDLFVFEDVYMGILVKKLKAKIVDLKKNYCFDEPQCFYGLNRKIGQTYYFFLNGLSPQMMINGWYEITDKMNYYMTGMKKPKIRFL